MSRSPRRTAAAAVTGALIGALALAGCGAGQIAATANQAAAVGGANVTAEHIAVRDAVIASDGPAAIGHAYRAGAGAPLAMSVVNQGTQPDRLLAVSSPVASGAEIGGTREIPGGQVLVVTGEPTAPVADEASTRESGSPRPPGSTDEDEAASSGPQGEAAATGGEPRAQIVLTGLREPVRPGLTYVVVLTFERAGEIRVEVPVANPDGPRPGEAAEH